jgi:hypothetical protein
MQRLVTECGKLLGLAKHKNLAADKVGSGPVVPACSKFLRSMRASFMISLFEFRRHALPTCQPHRQRIRSGNAVGKRLDFRWL